MEKWKYEMMIVIIICAINKFSKLFNDSLFFKYNFFGIYCAIKHKTNQNLMLGTIL